MAPSSHRRRPSRRPGFRAPGVPVVAVGAVAVVALLVTLVVAFRPDGGTEQAAVSDSRTTADSTQAPTPTSTPIPTPSPAPSSASATPAPRATGTTRTPSPRPSVTGASRRRTPAQASLSGRIRPGASYSGVATSYDVGNGDGACSYGPTSDVMTAAMNTADYETAKACGAYVSVRAASGKTITVRITNECPAPCEAGQLDLSQQAFAKLAPLSEGRIGITWKLVSPADAGLISIRYKTGSSQYWCGIQAIGHRNPLARLEVRTASGWTALQRAEYNYFLSEQGSGCGGAIRLTDIYGERLTVDALPVRADAVQRTGVQFAAH